MTVFHCAKIVAVKGLTLFAIIPFGLYISGCQPTREENDVAQVFIYCSKPLKPVVGELVRLCEARRGISSTIAAASDGALLSTLRHSRKGDLFASMSPGTIEAIRREKLANEIRTVAFAAPVLAISRKNTSTKSLEDLGAEGLRVGIVGSKGNALSQTTRKLCERAGVWERLQGNIVVRAKGSSELLRLLKLDAIDAAIVWNPEEGEKTADISVIALPKTETLRGEVQIVLLDCSSIPAKARAFLELALSDEAASVFRQKGYASKRAP